MGIAAALAAAACGQPGPDYSTAMSQVNTMFADAMASEKAGTARADDPVAACKSYQDAVAKLDAATKVMADMPQPDEKKAAAVGWAQAKEQIGQQKERISRSIARTCPA